MAVMPLVVLCDAYADLGTECPSPYQERCDWLCACVPVVFRQGELLTACRVALYIGGVARARPNRIVIYDNWQGGNGVTGAAFDRLAEIFERAHRLVSSCPCKEARVFAGSCGRVLSMLTGLGACRAAQPAHWMAAALSTATWSTRHQPSRYWVG